MKRYGRTAAVVVLLFLLALAIRVFFWRSLLAVNGDAGEVWDAYGYFYRGTGFQQMLASLLQGNMPTAEARLVAYSDHWPPMQALLLSLGFLAFGSHVVVGQGMMVLLSALTAPLVYLVTTRMSGPRAGVVASVIFAVYPSFIHLSLRLLSETTFIFLSLLILFIALVIVESARPRWAYALAVLLGVLLGVLALTRAAALPLIAALLLWLAWRARGNRRRLWVPVIAVAVLAITLLPWELYLYRMEGRPILVASSSEENLYRGNNPWIPDGFGSYGLMPEMIEAAQAYMAEHNVGDKQAYRQLALMEIQRNPGGFLLRGVYKVRELWSADSDIATFTLGMIYPPMSDGVAGAIFLITVVSLPLVLAFAVWGLLIPAPVLRYRGLILLALTATMVVIFVTMGEEARFHVTLLALLLPAVGHGVVHAAAIVQPGTRPFALAAGALVALMVVSIVFRVHQQYSVLRTFKPSSHYLGLVRQLDTLLGMAPTTVSDRLLLRMNGAEPADIQVAVDGTGYTFADLDGSAYRWLPASTAEVLNLAVEATDATQPLRLEVASSSPQASDTLSLSAAAWQRWQPTAIPGLEYMWVGSGFYPDKSNVGRAVARQEGDWQKVIIPVDGELSWFFKRYD